MNDIWDAIVLGGGNGRRFSQQSLNHAPKQFQELLGQPVLVHSVQRLLKLGCFRSVIITVPKDQFAEATRILQKALTPEWFNKVQIIEGGKTRQESSFLALKALDSSVPQPSRVIIHDACRPALTDELLHRVQERLADRAYAAWIPVTPVVETLKKVEGMAVTETVNRDLYYRVQTPQVFEYHVIRSLIEKAMAAPETAMQFTDDASLCEFYGIPVGVFEGDARNIKLTYDFEIDILSSVMRSEAISGEICE